MLRYVLIVLFLFATVPLVPHFLSGNVVDEREAEAGVEEVAVVPGGASRTLRLPRDRSGHYVAEVRVNGHSMDMLVDTGATTVTLPERLARDIGINLQPADFTLGVRTANGTTKGAPVRLREMKLGPIRLTEIDAIVLEDEALAMPLLGMSALNRLKRFDFSDDFLNLVY